MVEYSDALQENSINLLAIIDLNTFNQQYPTFQEWSNTLTQIVSSKDFSSVDAVEIWNEPNGLAYIPPSTYYEMLKEASVIIKDYSSIPVVFGGISPNIEGWNTYLTEVFANENVEDYFDYMGIHLYDDTQTNLNTLGFVKALTDKPVWLTETGKPSINNETEQAQYVGAIYEDIAPKVSKTFIYELYDGQGTYPPKENYFGLLTINGTRKEAYNLIYNLNKR
jgi:endo-1,4-beta-mannosidase